MKYLYYRLWKIFSGIPTNDKPATNAMLGLSVVNCVNLITILIFTNKFIRVNVLKLSENELIIFSIVLSLSMFTINYFLLYKKREEIAAKYNSENKKKKIIGTILLYSYIVGSFILVYAISRLFPLK